MYAIFEDGSHQYRVQKGDTIDLQLHTLDDDQKSVEFNQVLMIGSGAESRVGQPYVEGAKVVARVIGEVKGEKLDIIKFRRRKNYRRKTGHRQRHLRVSIESIEG